MTGSDGAARLVSNTGVRRAVEAFAAQPSQRGSIEVLRHCFAGELLLDMTGSELAAGPDGAGVGAGSRLAFATAEGPDGGRALLCFTANPEVERLHPGERYRSLAQPAVGVLQQARDEGFAWLYVDPAGPTCALSAREIDFALRSPWNDSVRAALEPGTPREQLVASLHADGPLLLASERTPEGERLRSVPWQGEGGGWALLAYTSSAEVIAHGLDDGVLVQTTAQVRQRLREAGWAGLVVNPQGPWAAVSAAELG